MQTEVEAKFIRIDLDDIRKKLTTLGATCLEPMRLMRRVAIDTPELKAKDAFIRIRDEGHKITITYKQFKKLSVDGAKEIEIQASDFQKAVDLFAAAGLLYRSYQETKRETWRLADVEIMLDIWPWLDPYLEIEGPSQEKVQEVATQLELEWKDAVFGDVMAAYRVQYPHLTDKDTVGNIRLVTFDEPLPELLIG